MSRRPSDSAIELRESEVEIFEPLRTRFTNEATLRLRHKLVEITRLTEANDRRVIQAINEAGRAVSMYGNVEPDQTYSETLPFRISPHPFTLPPEIGQNLELYGQAIVEYFRACEELYRHLPDDHRWKGYLDHSKAELNHRETRNDGSHLFVRPDFIITEEGLTTTEIETSPFGLGLAVFLNKQHPATATPPFAPTPVSQSFRALVEDNDGSDRIGFVVSEHTMNFRGQLDYLCRQLKLQGIDAFTTTPADLSVKNGQCYSGDKPVPAVYRGYYLRESCEQPVLRSLTGAEHTAVYPGHAAHLEEKALMGLLFEAEFEDFMRERLGPLYDTLLEIIPPTFVLDPNHVPDNFPEEISRFEEVADLPQSRRQFVVKNSGFSENESWGRSVVFLHKKSKAACREIIQNALRDEKTTIIQAFRKGRKFSQIFYDFATDSFQEMVGKVRVTPYFSTTDGQLLTNKATICADTDYVHGMSTAINTPVK